MQCQHNMFMQTEHEAIYIKILYLVSYITVALDINSHPWLYMKSYTSSKYQQSFTWI